MSKRKGPSETSAVLCQRVLERKLVTAIRTVPAKEFRHWLQRELYGLWFETPTMGECRLGASEITANVGLGYFCRGVAVEPRVWPAWGHHGDRDCGICEGEKCNEFSYGTESHTFCFRCVVAQTGDTEHVVENLLVLANHLVLERCNLALPKGRNYHKQGNGSVPLVLLKQTSPCHPEVFLNYGPNHASTSTLRRDVKICVPHPSGPSKRPESIKFSSWWMCKSCYPRLSKASSANWGVCGYCGKEQVRGKGDPVCAKCQRRFERFVWERTYGVLT
jgi:hypothetical protein